MLQVDFQSDTVARKVVQRMKLEAGESYLPYLKHKYKVASRTKRHKAFRELRRFRIKRASINIAKYLQGLHEQSLIYKAAEKDLENIIKEKE